MPQCEGNSRDAKVDREGKKLPGTTPKFKIEISFYVIILQFEGCNQEESLYGKKTPEKALLDV